MESSGVVVELIAEGLDEMSVGGDKGADKVTPDKAIHSTPSVVYDGVIILAPSEGYNDADNIGQLDQRRERFLVVGHVARAHARLV